MIIKTERLTIRRIVSSDWQSVKCIWEDFNASPFAQYDKPHCTDDDDVRARIARWAEANEDSRNEHMFFAVCLDGAIIGYIALNQRTHGYELGYCFHSAYHGKGYAGESHRAVFDYLASFGITHFCAGTALDNTPSVSLLKSLGFVQTATEKVSFCKDVSGSDIVFDGGVFELKTN